MSNPKNKWYLIVANNNSCQGYMPGETKEEACRKLRVKLEDCSVKEVEKTKNGFVEQDQYEQGKLL